jgi:hypothetical protein
MIHDDDDDDDDDDDVSICGHNNVNLLGPLQSSSACCK